MHDVFLSHSAQDRDIALAITHVLERRGIRCWLAPRDIVPGSSWDVAIIDAIDRCHVVVLVFSAHANSSEHIAKEVRNAVEAGKTVVPFRIEDMPTPDISKSLRYQLASAHWFEALTPPVEEHAERLADALEQMIGPGIVGRARGEATSAVTTASARAPIHQLEFEAIWNRMPRYAQLLLVGLSFVALSIAFLLLPRTVRHLFVDSTLKLIKVLL